MCNQRTDFAVKFPSCVSALKLWSDEMLNKEIQSFSESHPQVEDAMKSTFVIFVKLFYQRPGCPKLKIRLSTPPIQVFFKKFTSHIPNHDVIRTGAYFQLSNSLGAKDCTMDLIRTSLYECISDYVIVEEYDVHQTDDVHADDSVSQVGVNPAYIADEQRSEFTSASNMQSKTQSAHQQMSNVSKALSQPVSLSSLKQKPTGKILNEVSKDHCDDQKMPQRVADPENSERNKTKVETASQLTSSVLSSLQEKEDSLAALDIENAEDFDKLSSLSSASSHTEEEEPKSAPPPEPQSRFSKSVQDALSVVIDKSTVVEKNEFGGVDFLVVGRRARHIQPSQGACMWWKLHCIRAPQGESMQ